MENTIASLVDLPEPTGRMPFHLSPDGRQVAIGVQRRSSMSYSSNSASQNLGEICGRRCATS